MTDTLSAVLRERDSKREGLVQRDRDSENPAGRTNEMPSPEGVNYESIMSQLYTSIMSNKLHNTSKTLAVPLSKKLVTLDTYSS